MNITQFSTLVIDCDGILVNHCQGILTSIHNLQRNLPQDTKFKQAMLQFYLKHYYQLSERLEQNGFFASHCFAFQATMSNLHEDTSWKNTLSFGRTMSQWPIYEDSFGALQYFKKFFRVFIRCDREPEDIDYLIENLGITRNNLIIRTKDNGSLLEELKLRGENIDSCLLFTTPYLAQLTDFPNIQLFQRSKILNTNHYHHSSLAQQVFQHQNHLRS